MLSLLPLCYALSQLCYTPPHGAPLPFKPHAVTQHNLSVAVQVLAAGVTQFRLRYLSLRAAENLHDGMLRCLLRAPMAFFHVNPSGRVTNRFTKDTSDIDRNLAFYAAMWFQSMLQLLSTAVVIGAVTPFVLPVLVPLLLLFGMLYLYFQASVREIKRLDSVARSPIFTAVSNALTVRTS